MNTSEQLDHHEIQQGSQEWIALRKTKITATDANVIMGASHWKTKIQLYNEKKSNDSPMPPNERMQRGIDLEPIARDLFILKTGIIMKHAIIINPEFPWMMASLDGLSECGQYSLEIKCPGEKDHQEALNGRIPAHYKPQNQHQIKCVKPKIHFYFSFDGIDGTIIEVKQDDEYIEKMMIEEKKFYECLINNTPPQPDEGDYLERDDDLWQQCALKWKSVTNTIKELEKEEEELRKQLIFLSGESNTKGGGISLCQISRRGHVAYDKIPELKGVDLDKYRKASINSWRITCN